jgi:hypothetical protein
VGAIATRSSRQPNGFEILRAPAHFHHWTIYQTLFRIKDRRQRCEKAKQLTERAARVREAVLGLGQIEIPQTVELHHALQTFGAFYTVSSNVSPFWPLDLLPDIIRDLVDKSHHQTGMLIFPVLEFFARCAPLVAIHEATWRSIRQRKRRSRTTGATEVAMPEVPSVQVLRALRSASIDWGDTGLPWVSKVEAAVDSSQRELALMIWRHTETVRDEVLSALRSVAKECPGCFDLMTGQAVACSDRCADAVRQRRYAERRGPRRRGRADREDKGLFPPYPDFPTASASRILHPWVPSWSFRSRSTKTRHPGCSDCLRRR